MKCEEMFGTSFGVLMISDCLNASRTGEETIDGAIESRIPVTSKNNIVYKNALIARCNNEMHFDIWKLTFIFRLCADKIDYDAFKGMSNVEIANIYFQSGCEFRVTPASGFVPRFCIDFVHNDSVCSNKRIPVRSPYGTYRNRECCKLLEGKCGFCAESGIKFEKQLNFRVWTSMKALFQFRARDNIEEKLLPNEILSSAEATFHNVQFEKMLIASTLEEYDTMVLSRVLLFVEYCLQRALSQHLVSMSYRLSCTSAKLKGSESNLYLGIVEILIEDEIKPYDQIIKIKRRIEELEISYTEEDELKNITFHIRFLPRNQISFYTNTTVCTQSFLDVVNAMKKNDDFLNELTHYDGFPRKGFDYINCHIKRLNVRSSFIIMCKNGKKSNVTSMSPNMSSHIMTFFICLIIIIDNIV